MSQDYASRFHTCMRVYVCMYRHFECTEAHEIDTKRFVIEFLRIGAAEKHRLAIEQREIQHERDQTLKGEQELRLKQQQQLAISVVDDEFSALDRQDALEKLS